MDPLVSIVFLVFNRREELRESLGVMLGVDAPGEIELIVVDNGSGDGSSAMVRQEFPGVRLITRDDNAGISAFNDGFAAARGTWVLALDDDCYLPGDGLGRALAAAEEHAADLVSFGVVSSRDPDWRFDRRYRTGLLTFWGCAVLVRRTVLERLGGYDPGIFVWANELELTVRLFDAGFRHLHIPGIVAVHMKAPGAEEWKDYLGGREYRLNGENFAYVAGKLLRGADAAAVLAALASHGLRDGLQVNRAALRALPAMARGFARGLRRRAPVANPEVSRTYRRDFASFAPATWRPREEPDFYAQRPRLYPSSTATLEF